MADRKTVLIVDDAKRFDGQTLFEPEYHAYNVTNETDAVAFLLTRANVAVTLINLEKVPAAGLALLTAIREQPELDNMAVWICLDPQDEHSIEQTYKAGADELICRVPSDATLQFLVRRFKAFPVRYKNADTPVSLHGAADAPICNHLVEVLQQSDRNLVSIMNTVPGGIAVYDMSEKPELIYSNDVLSQMCGFSGSEYNQIMQADYHQLIDPRDYRLIDNFIESFRKKPRRLEGSFRILTKENTSRWVRMSATPVSEGKQCCVVFLDITQDKENELNNEQMKNELLYRTEYDALTGLNNREAFYRRTAEMLRTHAKENYVILVMDIDRFRVVNDIFGKEVGDRILISVSEGIKNLLGGVGTCARMEADHFAACFPQSMLDMDQILTQFDKRLKQESINFHVQLYFGIYFIRNVNIPVNHMCDRAAMAMKTIKGSAVHRFAYYDDKLRQTMLEENAILDEMNMALEEGQFVPFLQPVFNVDSDSPVSVEMLVRWQHPEKGLIPPGQFIPLFERNGFITKMDRYIWEQACRLLKDWQENQCLIPVSVNISRIDLYYSSIVGDLLRLTRQYGVNPSDLRLEITESAYTKDPQELVEIINQLRAEGFMILMDDFGSGYSSLNVLMDMPVDIIKLDLHFLSRLNTNPRTGSILTSIVRMAKWLNIAIVAEGVETPEQLAFLRSIGCDLVQGFLLARPMSIANYTREFIQGQRKHAPDLSRTGKQAVDLSYLWDISTQAEILFNDMIGGMGIYELSGEQLEIRRVNDGYYELFGCMPKQVFDSARNVLTSIHPDDRANVLNTCHKAAKSGRVERVVCRHIHYGDGRQMWLETRMRFLGKAGLNDVFFFTFSDVSEQKEFERASALRNYSHILSSVYSGVYELNLSADSVRIIHRAGEEDGNDEQSHTLLWLKGELQGMLFRPDMELLQSVFEPGYLRQKLSESNSSFYLLERMIRDESGHGRWVSFTFIPTPSDVGEAIFLLCIADVDSRKRSEELLQENQWLQLKQKELLRYQSLMDHLGTSLFEWNTDTGKTAASEGFNRYAISDYDFGALQSYKDIEKFIYSKDLNLFHILVNDLLGHGSSAVVLRLLDKHGSPIWCRVLCSFTTDESEHGSLLIAAIHQIDEQMKIRENYLDEQSRFQAFAENFLVGLGIFEVRGDKQRIFYLSEGYRKMIGYGENERFYDDQHSFANVHPDDEPRFIEGTRLLQQTGKPYTIDYRVFHKDGRILWMRSHNTLYPGPEPGVNRIFAVIENITELKALQAQVDTLPLKMPIAVGVYRLGARAQTVKENPLMADLFAAAGSAVPDAVSGGKSPTVLRSREDLLQFLSEHATALDGELDEAVLLARENRLVPARLLCTKAGDVRRNEYHCALFPAADIPEATL